MIAVASIRISGSYCSDRAVATCGQRQNGMSSGRWRAYSAEEASTRYSPLDQITRDNVKNLEVAWTWKFDNYGRRRETATTETTPLMVSGVLYFTAGQRRTVVAADAGTGETLWTWRPDEGARFDQAPRKVHRGVAYWTDGQRRSASSSSRRASSWCRSTQRPAGRSRASDRRASSISSSSSTTTCQLDPTGRIGNSSPPVISNDVIVVGPALTPGAASTSPTSRATSWRFDVRTGRKLWTFHTIPREGEPGFETWLGDSAEYTGNAGVWGPFSADPELGYVYLERRIGDQRCLRRPSSRQQPLLRLAGLPRHQDRQDDLVPAARAPRHLGLRHAAAPDPRST